MANFKLIKDIAWEKGFSIKDIADKIGLTPSSLHHLIKAGSTNTSTLEAISNILEVSPGIFFEEQPSLMSDQSRKIANLEKEKAYLLQILAEKERTIKILMESKEQ